MANVIYETYTGKFDFTGLTIPLVKEGAAGLSFYVLPTPIDNTDYYHQSERKPGECAGDAGSLEHPTFMPADWKYSGSNGYTSSEVSIFKVPIVPFGNKNVWTVEYHITG